MTTKNSGGPAFPEPEAYLYVNGKHRGVSLNFHGDMDLSEGTVRHALITTDQAEAYAIDRVREALEKAESIVQSNADACSSLAVKVMLQTNADAIRTLIPKEEA